MSGTTISISMDSGSGTAEFTDGEIRANNSAMILIPE
jgi:hypothetical protein